MSALEALHGDLERLGMQRRGLHNMRSTFITLALEGGGARDAIRSTTHAKSGEAFDGYLRLSWKAKCEAIELLTYAPADSDGGAPENEPSGRPGNPRIPTGVRA